jgi:iron complex outermembrane receptor protein
MGTNSSAITAGVLRGVCAVLAALLLGYGACDAADILAKRARFNIAPQPLSSALIEFSSQSGVQVATADADVSRVRSPGVRGNHTIDLALRRLLEGTGVRYETVGENTVAIHAETTTSNNFSQSGSAQPIQLAQGNPTSVRDSATLESQSVSSSNSSSVSSGSDNSKLEEIIVTARKREESILRTPVIMQAYTGEKLQSLNITDFYGLASFVPGLVLARGYGPIGAIVFLHGLGNDQASFVDSTVLINVDGIPEVHSSFLRTALFDVAQTEVLRGPQALFFGKSSSAGIIAIKTADPTSTFQSQLSVGYGFEANEEDVTGFVSGPLNDELGVRLAVFYNHIDGFMHNVNAANNTPWVPNGTESGGRLTLKYDPTDLLHIKLKMQHSESRTTPVSDFDQTRCTGPLPQVAQTIPFDDCKLNNTTTGNPAPFPYKGGQDYSLGGSGFATGNPSPLFKNGRDYLDVNLNLASLQLDANVANGLTLTSLTGYDESTNPEASAAYLTPPATDPFGRIDIAANYWETNFSQELRLTSNFKDSWLNYMVGAFYGQTESRTNAPFVFRTAGLDYNNTIYVMGQSKSAFAQTLLTPIRGWELSLGARYSWEHKQFQHLWVDNNFSGSGPVDQVDLIPADQRRITEHDVTPEATLTYRPSDDLMTFVSYKQGYKAPGFNVSLTSASYVGSDPHTLGPFRGETSSGYEAGVKGKLFDNQFALSAAIYDYDYRDLQVAVIDQATLESFVNSAAKARLWGLDLSLAYAPQAVQGLAINGYVNYNRATYVSFPNAGCWGGQDIASGCSTNDSSGFQNLSGYSLLRAARITGQVGVDYSRAVSDAYSAALGLNINFSSKYNWTAVANPGAVQGAYATLDATLRFGKLRGPWEVSLIGRNLTNQLYAVGGNDGGVVTPGVRADVSESVNRPREIYLRITVRPELWGHATVP